MAEGIAIPKVFDAEVTAEIDGEEFGPFDTFNPGEVSSSTGRHRPGGQRTAVRTRGLPERSTGELTVVPKTAGELTRYRALERKAGRVAMKVVEQPLDVNGDPQGKAAIWTGLLESININNVDSDSSDDRQVTLTFGPDDEAA
jgi:hypothetical protein